MLTSGDDTYQNGAPEWRIAPDCPQVADYLTVPRLHVNDEEEAIPTATAIMPANRGSAGAAGVTPITTDERFLTVLGAYIDQVGVIRPTTVKEFFGIIDSLIQVEGQSTAVNLLTRQLQENHRDLNDIVV